MAMGENPYESPQAAGETSRPASSLPRLLILRSILGVVVGFVVAGTVVMLLELAGHLIFPPPPGMDPMNMESVKEHLPNLPVGAFVCVLGAWTIGIFVGALLAGLIAGRAPLVHGGIVGVVFLGFCIMNLVMIKHPLWFTIAALAAVPLATLGAALAARRPPQTPEVPQKSSPA